jgi:1,2-phenylacetyl-CoA epoxidase catalytic subunit
VVYITDTDIDPPRLRSLYADYMREYYDAIRRQAVYEGVREARALHHRAQSDRMLEALERGTEAEYAISKKRLDALWQEILKARQPRSGRPD